MMLLREVTPVVELTASLRAKVGILWLVWARQTMRRWRRFSWACHREVVWMRGVCVWCRCGCSGVRRCSFLKVKYSSIKHDLLLLKLEHFFSQTWRSLTSNLIFFSLFYLITSHVFHPWQRLATLHNVKVNILTSHQRYWNLSHPIAVSMIRHQVGCETNVSSQLHFCPTQRRKEKQSRRQVQHPCLIWVKLVQQLNVEPIHPSTYPDIINTTQIYHISAKGEKKKKLPSVQ